jgi:pyruvate/2-oxoglutarate dehydrogenase complex dihydrolipoamide acyltransferase (E2) component
MFWPNKFMPKVPITMPQLGESMAEATIVAIKVKPGEKVAADQEIIEVETDKAVMGVTTPCPGKISKIEVEVKGIYPVGAVLGYVEASEADAARFVKQAPEPPNGEVAKEVPGREEESAKAAKTQNGSGSHFQVDETSLPQVAAGSHFQVDKTGVLPVPAGAKGAGYLSPRVKARMAELQLTQADLAAIQGTGNAGRVTIEDLETFLGGLEKQTSEDASAIRTGVADAMRRSWTRPLATVGVSVCLDPVLEDRKRRDPKPGPALYVLRALALALAETPDAAARLIGGRALRLNSIDIGVAVEAQDGIMVPVIRSADKTSLADLTSRYTELVDLARRRRVTSEMTSGGIASVSNFGTFGLDWGTPIPLPDQTLLLGLGAGKKAPTWSEEKQQFVPTTQAELTLSFDHRSLDGGGAGRLLQHVVKLLGTPEKL